MCKRILFLVAFVMFFGPTFVTAQDIFFSFDEFSRVPTATVDSDVADTGSVFIFADENFDFNQMDVDFSTSNPNVAAFTGGVVYNPGSPTSGTSSSAPGGAFTFFDLLDPNSSGPINATDGRVFATSFLSPGQQPGSGASNFRAGANGFLLAQLDYDLGGGGMANFDFSLGDLGVVNDGVGQIVPTFGSAELTALGDPAPPYEPPVVPPVDPPVVPPVDPPVVPPVDPPVSPSKTADFFYSFDQNSRVPTATLDSDVESTGSVFIFADAASDFNQLDINFTNSESSVVSITGGTTFNTDGSFTELDLMDPNDAGAGPTATEGRLFGVSVGTQGLVSETADLNADYRQGADGVLLAQIDFDIIGGGTTNFDFLFNDSQFLGGRGAVDLDFDSGAREFPEVGFESGVLTILGQPVDPPVVPPVDPPVVPPVDPPVDPPVAPPTNSNPDIFFSFDENSRVTDLVLGLDTNSTSVFLFADEDFDVNQLDLDFTIGNNDVLSISGGTTFNADGSFTDLVLLDPNDANAGPTSTDARLFGISFLTPGIVAGNFGDPDYRAGANGFLLARIDFDILGAGSVDIDLIPGELGFVNDGLGAVVPTFGSATFTLEGGLIAIPEPSSAMLLVLAAGGMISRRKRS